MSEARFTIGDPNGNNAAWVYDGDTKIAKIEEAKGDSVLSLVSLAQRAETLTRRVEYLEGLLRLCRSDIFQTARVNQANLTGVDLLMPDDLPCIERIGKHHVHQQGVNESLKLVDKIAAALAAKGVK